MSLEEEMQREQQLAAEVSRRTRSLTAEVARLTRSEADAYKTLDAMTQLEGVVRRPPKWTIGKQKPGEHRGIVCAQLTDTHFDERVRPEEVGNMNAYSRAIAVQRLKRWTEKVITLPRLYVSGVQLQGLFVPATGDLLSGNIHPELKESNEDHLFSSADYWIDQLISSFELLIREYPQVHVAAVVGNHGRSTLKPVFKGRARTNIEWLIWRTLARHFAGDEAISFQVSDSMDLSVPILGTQYLLTHGDQFRGGTGISGAMAPLMLGLHRKTTREASTSTPMDIMVMGHWHQYLTLPGLIVGGSMKGYDEYAYGLNLRPEPPRQAAWITTPERGPTFHFPIDVANRKEEGW